MYKIFSKIGVAILFILIFLNSQAQVWQYVGSSTTGISSGGAQFQSLAFSQNGVPYVAFRDNSNGNKTTVVSFNGSNWGALGNAGISAGDANYQSLAFSPNGIPYVAYRDVPNGGKTTVMSFNGTNWGTVGTAGISTGETLYQSLAFSPNGIPYVAYSDYLDGLNLKSIVLSFNGTNWGNVGSYASSGQSVFQSLAFNPQTGMPFLAFQDGFFSFKTTVMSFNGTNWGAVGSAGISSGQAQNQSLAFGSNGVSYVAYRDGANGQKTTVLSFNGSNWGTVGSVGISSGQAIDQSLTTNQLGIPFVAYRDVANSQKTTVLSFNGSNWDVIGSVGFSAGASTYNSLKINPITGEPYVAYQDQLNFVQKFGVQCQIPFIISQPISQTICGLNLATFAVSATGTSLNYLWSNGESTQIINTSVVGNYLVTVAGSCGIAISTIASLITKSTTNIINHPATQTICTGTSTIFAVSAVGENLSYVWSNGLSSSALMSTSLTGNYLVTVSGTCGKAISNSFSLQNSICGINNTITSAMILFSTTIPGTFTGTAGSLSWQTLSGATSYCIRYSKSADFITTVTTVCGLTAANYLFVLSASGLRTEATNQVIYYQVLGVDANGNISQWSAIQSFVLRKEDVTLIKTSLNQLSNFAIYPNPTSGFFTIQAKIDSYSDYKIAIYNALGTIVYTNKLKSEITDFEINLNKGIYLVKVGDKLLKLIVQ